MTQLLEQLQASRLSRRGLLQKVGGITAAAGAVSLLAGCPRGVANLDVPILNFALNLEYLEAEYYLRGLGQSLAEVGANPGAVTGGRAVTFTRDYWQQYVAEIAEDERKHVQFLRTALGAAAVDRPAINFTDAFDAAGQAAGLGAGFDPFADELSFITGAFIFEDVGVTAYKGGAPLITNPAYLEAAAGIMAVEAYHAATIRTTIWNSGDPQVTVNVGKLQAYKAALSDKAHANPANAISDARDSLDGPSDIDQPLAINGLSNIVPADENGIAYSRTVAQVHNIAYLTPDAGVTSGGFFPNGTNNIPAFTTT